MTFADAQRQQVSVEQHAGGNVEREGQRGCSEDGVRWMGKEGLLNNCAIQPSLYAVVCFLRADGLKAVVS